MKNKIIIILDVVFALAAVAGIVFFTIANNESNNLNGTLTNAKTSAISAKAEYFEKTKQNNVSTPDEIVSLKREIEEAKADTNDGQKKIKANILSYVDILYNTEGDFKSNKDKILTALEPYVDPSFLESQIGGMFSIGSGTGAHVDTYKKKISDFCTSNDLYMTVEEYEDGSDLYIAVCELHFKNLSQYHVITAANTNGRIMINSDQLLSGKRDTALGG